MAADPLHELSSSGTSEEEDEDAKELTENVEKSFFKTLSYIKKKDPKIYDESVKFFSDKTSSENQNQRGKKKKQKDTPLTLRDYERKLIVERGGELSDEEQDFNNDENRPQSPTYVEEQKSLKESFKNILSDESDNEDNKWGGLFHKREKTAQEVIKENEEYRKWLKGQKNEVTDKNVESDLKFLHDYWTDPKLEKGEQFLRDYILNKKYLEKEEEPELDVEKLLEEEKELEEQTEFEHKYNYRFEEPDQEFIKRYPRIMTNSLRTKDEKRKVKRLEIKERKTKEKEKKKEEIKKKKKLKKKEIEEKLEELRKLTGNDQLAFESNLNADEFDQDEYDRTMKRLFNEEFYSQQDPTFQPGDDITEDCDGMWNEDYESFINDDDNDNMTCEDPNFIMDCDYDPSKVPKRNKKEGKGRRARDKHRRTTVSEAVSKEKPVFDPTEHCSFQQYLDQYYGIDCEDFVGDLPCRFKYKRITPNSYGLTVEEILAADDNELERWCSMKRVQKISSAHKEKNDSKMYSIKAKDEELKQKILPSLYSQSSENDKEQTEIKLKKKKKKKNKLVNLKENEIMINEVKADTEENDMGEDKIELNNLIHEKNYNIDKNRKNKHPNNNNNGPVNIDEKLDKNVDNFTKSCNLTNAHKKSKIEKRKRNHISIVGQDLSEKDTNIVLHKVNKSHNGITDCSNLKNMNTENHKTEKKKRKPNIIDEQDLLSKVSNNIDGKMYKSPDDINDCINLKNMNKTNHKIEKKKRKRNSIDEQGLPMKVSKIYAIDDQLQKNMFKTNVSMEKNKNENTSNISKNGLDLNKTEGKSRRQKKNEKAKLLKEKFKKTHKYSKTLKMSDKFEKKIRKGNSFKVKANNNKIGITDSRLKAYGIKPKIFKNKLKYGKQFSTFGEE